MASMVVLAAGLAAEAQSANNAYIVEYWQAADGLPENLVRALVQTHDGYLWVGTFGGLARFDGVRFVNFGVHNVGAFANNRVTSLYEDCHGDLWIGGDYGGITRLHAGGFTRYSTLQGLTSDHVVGAAEDNHGNLWVGGDGGICRWKDGRFVADECSRQLGNKSVLGIHAGLSGRVWITAQQGLYVIEAEKLAPYPLSEAVGEAGGIWNTLEDATGHLWVYNARCATRFTLGQIQGRPKSTEPILRAPVRHMCEGPHGDIWLATSTQVYHWRDNQGTNFDLIENIQNDEVRAIYEDREQNVWVGTKASGLIRLHRRKIKVLPVAADSKDQDTLTVVEDSTKRLWVGTYNAGLYRSAAGQFESLSQAGAFDSPTVWSLCAVRDGSLWAGTRDGLFRINGGTVSRFDVRSGHSENELQSVNADADSSLLYADKSIISPGTVHSLYADTDGSLWVGTFRGGLAHLDQGKFIPFAGQEALKDKYITCILRTLDETLWVGSNGWGLYRMVGDKFVYHGKNVGLSSDLVLALYQDHEGRIWVGTQADGGLSLWCGNHFANFTRNCGLPTDAVKAILEDDLGSLWLGSNRGIVRVSKNELNDFADGKISWLQAVTYGSKDGLRNVDCRGSTQPVACRTSDGRLWFATRGGLAVLDPHRMISHGMPPPVVIERVRVDGRSVWPSEQSANWPPGSKRLSVEFDVELAHEEEGCEFQYTSPSLAAPEKVQFRYRLEGLDGGWTEAGSQRTAVYKYLPPGKYRFQVIARDENGVWNKAGAAVTLFRPAPFWRASWFLTLAGLTIVLSTSGCVRWLTKRRIRHKLEELERQHALERERGRIARDIHDDLGASLTKISKLTEIMDQRTGAQDRDRPMMQTIAGTANEAIRAIDEIVWAVNPANDTLGDLASYLVHFAQEFLRSIGVSYELDVPLSLPKMLISAEIRHNLLMTVKEALNNAVKHGAPTKVRINLKLEASVLIIEVSDNGRGFCAGNGQPTGRGLENMRKRLNAVGGKIRLSSQLGLGTTLEVRVDLSPSTRHKVIKSRED